MFLHLFCRGIYRDLRLLKFSSNIKNTVNYWSNILKGKLENHSETSASLSFDSTSFRLNFILSKEPINHAKAFGRVAFSCPTS